MIHWRDHVSPWKEGPPSVPQELTPHATVGLRASLVSQGTRQVVRGDTCCLVAQRPTHQQMFPPRLPTCSRVGQTDPTRLRPVNDDRGSGVHRVKNRTTDEWIPCTYAGYGRPTLTDWPQCSPRTGRRFPTGKFVSVGRSFAMRCEARDGGSLPGIGGGAFGKTGRFCVLRPGAAHAGNVWPVLDRRASAGPARRHRPTNARSR